jgi:hypothetical protein
MAANESTMNSSIRGGTIRTESQVCQRAYESTNPLTRFDPEDPKTPFYELERYWLDEDKSKRYELFSRRVIQKYLNLDDPFMLKTHNPDTKLTKVKLEQAMGCIWKKYYAPLAIGYNQQKLDELRKNQPIVKKDDVNIFFDFRRGYIEHKSLKQTFENFMQRILESKNLNVTNNSISEECSSFMNPTDVFAPCQENCIDIERRHSKKNLSQPRLMQKELTKFDKTLKDVYTHLIQTLEETKSELRNELKSRKIHPKRINEILSNKFGSITIVPETSVKKGTKAMDTRAMDQSSSADTQQKQNNRNKEAASKRRQEAAKKRRQKLQNRLIKTVVNDKGKLISNYENLFTLETPFNLSNKGKIISKNTGVLKTRYDRSNKRIELQLRFKANQALKNTQNSLNKKIKEGKIHTNEFAMLSEKADLLRGLIQQPHANKPLKLVRYGTKTTVAKGGDR